jgi:hypothetical protein
MKSFLTLVVILSVAIGIFYAVTSSNLLVRYSYDVYACASPSGETIELKFNDIEIGENVVLTSANVESTLEILQASQKTKRNFYAGARRQATVARTGRASVNFVL